MSLRGFDSYDVSLGDEMRGERASLGKSIPDVENDMRINGRVIEAIENCDVRGFPNPSVISGYVRSYSRYLGMDPEACFERFCRESGHISPASLRQGALVGQQLVPSSSIPGVLSGMAAGSPFGHEPRRRFVLPGVSFGGVTSTFALLGLIAGLAYGGYELLQEIQRVGFAPLPEAPTVVADAPVIAAPVLAADPLSLPAAGDYASGGALAAVVVPAELPDLREPSRDGPISAIDPLAAGMFSESDRLLASSRSAPEVEEAVASDLLFSDSVRQGSPTHTTKGPEGVFLVASEDAWVRVRGDGGTVLYEGILGAGERFDLPTRLLEPVLRAGNAGGIFVVVDGVTYGPVGKRGRVVSGVSLRASDVRSLMPEAEEEVFAPSASSGTEQRADASQISTDR